MNFLPGGGGYATPASLDLDMLEHIGAKFQRIESAKFQKTFYTLSEEEMRNGFDGPIASSISYRMDILISASLFRNGKKIGKPNRIFKNPVITKDGWVSSELNLMWSDDLEGKEEGILKKSEREIDFELGRRSYAKNAPSRITCLFMVEDSDDGRVNLSNIYYGRITSEAYSPMILELGICKKEKIIKVDSTWFNLYCEENNPDYIRNYWLAKPSSDPNWEILFEGMVGLRSSEQKKELKTLLNKFTGNYK